MAATISPSVGPRIGDSGMGSDSITVTGKPRARQEAATSRPMNPAPTIATRGASINRPPQHDRVVQTAEGEQACPWRDGGEGPNARTRHDDQAVIVGEGAVG